MKSAILKEGNHILSSESNCRLVKFIVTPEASARSVPLSAACGSDLPSVFRGLPLACAEHSYGTTKQTEHQVASNILGGLDFSRLPFIVSMTTLELPRMSSKLESTDAKNKLEDLSGVKIQPGENPYKALIAACNNDTVCSDYCLLKMPL